MSLYYINTNEKFNYERKLMELHYQLIHKQLNQ